MFKVSFKETPKNPSKLVTKMGNKTAVILKCTCTLPAFWKHIPDEIIKWIEGQNHVEGYEDIANNILIIYSKGVSRCHPDDKFDNILGERLAESRAKEHIYKFFYFLTKKLSDYYTEILYGNDSIVGNGLNAASSKFETLHTNELCHRLVLEGKVNGKQ